MLAGSSSGNLLVWDMVKAQLTASIPGHEGKPLSPSLPPTGLNLVISFIVDILFLYHKFNQITHKSDLKKKRRKREMYICPTRSCADT